MDTLQDLKRTLVTSKDIEDLFNISRTTVWRHSRNGVFKKIRIGQRIYFDLKDVKRIVRPE